MRSLTISAFGAALLAAGAASAADLRIGLQEDPDVLDPHRARTFVGRLVFTSLCDKLIDITPGLELTPQLATEWSLADDGRSVTMKLRDDATFHDGAKIDAAAVKANIERAKTLPDSLRRSELTSVETVEAVDPATVRFNLSHPDATLLAQLADRAGMMLAPSAFGDEEFGRNPVCSGPYRFVERVQNDRMVLEKWADHRDAADYHFDRLVFLPIPDTTVRFANLQAGDLDLLERLAATDLEAARGNSDLEVVSTVGIGYQGLTLNLNNGERSDHPLGQDPRVRQAFSLAIDRNIINEVVFAGTYPPTVQPFPQASPYFGQQFPVPARDVEKARALLREAGHETISFELQFANNNIQQQVNELIQAMVAEAGIQINLRATEFAAMQKEMQAGNFQVTQIGWSGRVDPDGNIHQFVSCGGSQNDPKYCNEEVDRLLNEARQTNDQAARKRLYDQAQAILQADLPYIYLYYQPWTFAMTNRIEGFSAYPDGMIRLRGVRLAG